MLGLEMAYANMDDGFPEALLRALRKGFLDDNAYSQLRQTSNISEFKLVLEDSDYGTDIFSTQDPSGDFEVSLLRRAMKEKLAAEFEYLRA
jgi:V-type H+-transporting ATPase subunit d